LGVSVVSTFVAGESEEAAIDLRQRGVTVHMIGPCSRKLRRHPDLSPTLRRIVAEADIIHIHALWEEIQHEAAILCRELGKPYIIRPCGMLDPWSLSQGWLKKQVYLWWRMRADLDGAAAIHYTTDLERDLAGGLKLASPAVVEPNGLLLEEFDSLPAPGTFGRAFPQLDGRDYVLFLSRIHPKKGLDLLIPAFAGVRHDGLALVIAGPEDGAYGDVTRELAELHGLDAHVLFTGMLRGSMRLAAMRDAILFVLPSYQENFGIVVIEALACGCPAIVSDQVNLHREVVAGQVGASVPTHPGELQRELARWLGDAALRSGAAARARPFVLERFDWNKIAARWGERYDQMISSYRSARG
jgi:glycosyltransferase involved in cell wall biosynthesis